MIKMMWQTSSSPLTPQKFRNQYIFKYSVDLDNIRSMAGQHANVMQNIKEWKMCHFR